MITRRHLLRRRARAPRLPFPDLPKFAEADSRRRRTVARRARGHQQLRHHGHAARQEAADPAGRQAAELRSAARIFPHADHAERSVLRALSPRRHSRGRPEDLQDLGRRRRRQRPGRIHARRSQEQCRRSKWSRSISARATGAACPSRMSPASNGATAPWAARAGRARGSRTCSPRSALKKEAIEIAFNGADGPAVDKTPDFIKSLPAWKAIDENTIIAYEMNGAPLPHFNGFPARLIVPGWTGTYWMKHLITVNALTKPQGGFWMKPAYRIPVGEFPVVARFITQEDATSTPITEIVVNSLITSHRDGAKVKARQGHGQRLAWDGGYGIRTVEVSTDGGKTWTRDARPGSRPLRVPAVELRAARQARQEHGDGQRHQQDRPDADRRRCCSTAPATTTTSCKTSR